MANSVSLSPRVTRIAHRGGSSEQALAPLLDFQKTMLACDLANPSNRDAKQGSTFTNSVHCRHLRAIFHCMQREVDLRDRFLVQQGFLYSAVIHGCHVDLYEKNRRKGKEKNVKMQQDLQRSRFSDHGTTSDQSRVMSSQKPKEFSLNNFSLLISFLLILLLSLTLPIDWER